MPYQQQHAGNKLLVQASRYTFKRHWPSSTGTFIGRQYGSDQNNDYAGPVLSRQWLPTFSILITLINSVIFPVWAV